MENTWSSCKNILCIRPDNMGDLIMSGPAMRALKHSFNAHITVLTSSMAAGVAKHMPEIDEVMIFDTPWVKTDLTPGSEGFFSTVAALKERNFDAAVIFTVYSQNPLPSVMLAYLAGIPKRLAYCRENPYQLLTDWSPDKEPYTFVEHQVKRDLDLVASIDAISKNHNLSLSYNEQLWPKIENKLSFIGVDTSKKWMLLHAGVSEEKRQYPIEKWIMAGKRIIDELGYQIVLTGAAAEQGITDRLKEGIGEGSFSACGLFPIDEFISLIKNAPVLLSVNTGTVHIAAALGTPVVVLYALTNPQHTPWRSPNRVLPFQIATHLQSKNEVIRFVNNTLYNKPVPVPTADDIIQAVTALLDPSVRSSDEDIFVRSIS